MRTPTSRKSPRWRKSSRCSNEESAAKKSAKEAQAALEVATLKKYGALSEADVKALVLDDKWEAIVAGRINNVLTSLVFALVTRIRVLGERYDETVNSLDSELYELNNRVAVHLMEMGVR